MLRIASLASQNDGTVTLAIPDLCRVTHPALRCPSDAFATTGRDGRTWPRSNEASVAVCDRVVRRFCDRDRSLGRSWASWRSPGRGARLSFSHILLLLRTATREGCLTHKLSYKRDWQLLGHGIPCDDLAIERGAQLGRATLRGVVHIVEAEAVPVAVRPLEVVHQAPEEVALHGHAVGHGAL
jgi:hypothetical protein